MTDSVDGLEVARITIVKTLTHDDVLIDYETSGEADEVLVAMGMLAMTMDTVMRGREDDDE